MISRRVGPERDRGAATLLVVALAGVLLLIGAAAGVVGALVVGHRRAQAAADLAALAGAVALQSGDDPCGAARSVAQANDATLEACVVHGSVITVDVVVAGPRWWGQDRDLTAAARAGPAGPDP